MKIWEATHAQFPLSPMKLSKYHCCNSIIVRHFFRRWPSLEKSIVGHSNYLPSQCRCNPLSVPVEGHLNLVPGQTSLWRLTMRLNGPTHTCLHCPGHSNQYKLCNSDGSLHYSLLKFKWLKDKVILFFYLFCSWFKQLYCTIYNNHIYLPFSRKVALIHSASSLLSISIR